MAKFQGFIGTGRGKAGNLVFAKGPNGSTIARAYQPQVTNPKTTLQIRQRAKVNAMGRFSRLFNKRAINAIGGNALYNRSWFNSNLVNTAKYSPSQQTASIVPELVKFSKGTQEFDMTQCSIAPSQDFTRTQVTITFPAATEAYNLKIIAAYIPGQGEDFSPWGAVATALINKDATTVTVTFPYPDEREADVNGKIYVWCVASIPDDTYRQNYERLFVLDAPQQEDINAVVENLADSVSSWSATKFAGYVPIEVAP